MSDTFFAMKSLHKNARRPKLKTRNTLVFVFPCTRKYGTVTSRYFVLERATAPLSRWKKFLVRYQLFTDEEKENPEIIRFPAHS